MRLSKTLLLLLGLSSAHAATITVDTTDFNTTTNSECSLLEAINNANDNAATYADCTAGDDGADTINLSGLSGTITKPSSSVFTTITDELSIIGPNAGDLIIDASAGSLFHIISDIGDSYSFSNFTIQNASRTSTRSSAIALSPGINLSLENMTIRNNSTADCGAVGMRLVGGIDTSTTTPGHIQISNSIFENNTRASSGSGSALCASNSVYTDITITDSHFDDNVGISGGAIKYNATGHMSVSRTSFISNDSEGTNVSERGGAIDFSALSSTGEFINTVFVSNKSAGWAGAMYINASSVDIFSSTFYNNVSDSNGDAVSGDAAGALFGGNEVNVKNTIIADNELGKGSDAVGLDCYGDMVSLGNNLIGETHDDCTFSASTDLTGTEASPLDARIASERKTATSSPVTYVSLYSDSPAIDAGDNTGCKNPDDSTLVNDLRGAGRSVDGNDDGTARCDIGAYEFGALGIMSFTQTSYEAAEDDLAVNISVSRSINTSTNATIDIVSWGGTATSGTDYTGEDTTLIFNAGDTNDQTYAITLVDDSDSEGGETINLRFYDFTGSVDVLVDETVVNIIDDDSPGEISLTEASVTVNEADSTAIITLTRSGGNGGVASIDYTTADDSATATNDYTSSTSTLTWMDGESGDKSIQIALTNDAIMESTEQFNVNLSNVVNASLTGSNTIAVTIVDNDNPNITTTTSSGSNTIAVEEGFSNGTISFVLDTMPSGNVTITPSTNTLASLSASSFVFTPSNWDEAQVLTITPTEDNIVLDSAPTNIAIDFTVASNDDDYDGFTIDSLTTAITDNDSASITVTQSNGSSFVSETGTTDTYTIVLNAQPLEDVVINIGDIAVTDRVTATPSMITFTSSNWDTPQEITLAIVGGSYEEGSLNNTANIVHSVTSASSAFDGLSVSDVAVEMFGTTEPGATLTLDATELTISEGNSTTFDIRLNTQPDEDVTVNFSADTSDVTFSFDETTYTVTNWDNTRTVTVTSVENGAIDGDKTVTISYSISSSDAQYNFDSADIFTLTINDDDTAGGDSGGSVSSPLLLLIAAMILISRRQRDAKI